ncbi:MAG: non-ribosomal peptide synthetase [Betaproteobacteria bacterium]
MASFPTLQAALDARAASSHGVTFVNGENDERHIEYGELRRRALAVLFHLQRAGAAPGSELILLTERNEQFVDTFWAGVMGCIAVAPIAPGNADEHRLKFFRVLTRLARPHLAVERAAWQRLAAFAAANGLEREWARLDRHTVFLDEIAAETEGRRHPASAGDVALVQFSSGSTSEPKGVVLTHGNLVANIDAIIDGIDAKPEDRSLSWMPLTHDMGLIGFHLTPLVADVDHALMPTALFVRRPLLWLAKATQHRASVLASPNFGYKHYLKSFDPAKAAGLDLSSVRVVFNGAEPISAELCAEFLAALAPYGLRGDVMFPVYGLAEASLAVTFPPPGRPLAAVALDRGRLGLGDVARTVDAAVPGAVTFVRVGTPVRGCALRVAGADGATLPDGTVGRILIRGDNVTQGYYDDPATTADWMTADGWLDTGDLGVIVDGELAVTGRIKEILFVAGQNYYPHDVEAILDRHAGIELGRAAVAGVRPQHAATDDVLVFVVAKGAPDAFVPVARTVRRVVNEQMGVAVAAVVPVPRLPKTTSGKIQRYALARDWENGVYADVVLRLATLEAAAAPTAAGATGELEQMLLEMCKSALPGKSIGVDDNLFELGSSSLTLAQIYERIEAAYPGRLEVTDFFEYPTVRTMAGFLSQRLADGG